MNIQPSMGTVFAALVGGFDQLPLTDGTTLTCASTKTVVDKVSEAELPFLLLKNGPAKLSEYTPFVYQVMWDITGTLKVKSEPGHSDLVLQSVLEDIFGQSTKLRGLFVDKETGDVVPLSRKALSLFRQNRLISLAYRGGPFVTSAATRPNGSERAYGIADIVIRVEFLTDKDPSDVIYGEEMPIGYATLFSVGTIPRAVDSSYPLGDNNAEFKYQIPTPAPAKDTVTQGRYAGNDSRSSQFVRLSPPFPNNKDFKNPKGVPYSSLTKSVNVTPYAVALSSGTPTAQLSAISINTDYSTAQATVTSTWASSNTLVATVNASGLVTRVGAGSCTIQATNNGVPSNLVAITVT